MSHVIGSGRYGRETYPVRSTSSGGTDVPFSSLKYVDSATTVPLAQQNGSDEFPYSTIQGAINANPGILLELFLAATVYPETVTVPAGAPVVFNSAGLAGISDLIIAPGGTALTIGGILILGTLSVQDGSTFDALGGYTVTGATILGDIAICDSFLAAEHLGTITIGDQSRLTMRGSYALRNAVSVSAATDIGVILCTASTDPYFDPLGIQLSLVSEIVAPGYDIKIEGASCAGEIVCKNGGFTACSIKDVNVTAVDLYLRGSNVGTGQAFVTTGRVQIIDSNVDAATWDNAAGQPFELDSFSNYWIKINGTALTNAGEKVITSDTVP